MYDTIPKENIMATFKCKMCGATLEIEGKKSIVTCEYCDTQQTLPKLQDARIAGLYDRANHFRRNNDFDKAMGIYETILNEDTTDAEAYWSLVLCRYGIEYVEDPLTKKRIPTVNRAQFTSVFDDENYKSALAHADHEQRKLYEAEANAINEIQKGLLSISQNEDPFDVFICYKESDANGRRTVDSVLATELYQELTREGLKVFFARITLEDKLGVAYEPYIFAALQSAKVMVVLGTKPEHFNAVWVKNEWSRYLALIKNGAKKTLVPAYRDMDPYDLPDEFAHLQAQDMSKLGYLQDMTRGIGKIVNADKPKTANASTKTDIAPLLKRAFLALEDGEFDRADEFCEQVLNQDPENAEAYLGKLMAELKVNRKNALQFCGAPFHTSKNYQKVVRFGDAALVNELKGYLATIKERKEQKAKAAADARKETLYQKSVADYQSDSIFNLENALQNFNSLIGYKDSAKYVTLCQNKLNKLQAEENQKAEERRLEEEKRKTEELRIAEKKRKTEELRLAKLAKKRKTRAVVSILAIVFAIGIGLAGYFGIYPWMSAQQGNYAVYINMYKVEEFTIPDGVTEIADNAFTFCDSLTTVNIPDSVTKIGYGAFSYCTNLTSITIPDSVTTIDTHAFSHCPNLTSIIIPENVVEIGETIFEGCDNLWNITVSKTYPNLDPYRNRIKEYLIPEGTTEIEDHQFEGYSGLSSIVIPNSVSSIGQMAFYNCLFLNELIIPDSVTTIAPKAFIDCHYLTSITIPDSVTSLGAEAFKTCTRLTSVTLSANLTSIEDSLFSGCHQLNSVYIPEGITKIGRNAFDYCTSLTSITLPNSLTEIGYQAFNDCYSLTSIVIPQNVTIIDQLAFSSCESLTSVTIPAGITKIGNSAFVSCKNLTSITFTGTQAQWAAISKGPNWNNKTPSTLTIHCTDGDITP